MLDVPSQVQGVELVRVRIPMLEPFVSANGTESERDIVLVHLIADDAEGWGECSTLSAPTYSAEHTGQAWSLLCQVIGPDILAGAGRRLEPDPDHPMAWCAVEVALQDLGGSPYRFMGGSASFVSETVESTCVIGRKTTLGELSESAERALANGYRSMKLKVSPGWDIEPLTVVRSLSPEVMLAVDANASYAQVGVDALVSRDLDRFGLAYIEQPFAAGDLSSHVELRQRVSTPVALDESIGSAADLATAVGLGAVDVVNVKPARLGGLSTAFALTVQARVQAGIDTFVGGMLESGVGRSAALALAASAMFTLPTDLGPSSRYFDVDVTDPIEFVSPGVLPGPGHSLVRSPIRERLDAFAVARVVLDR